MAGCVVICSALFASAAPAAAAPAWELGTQWAPTILQPGESARLTVSLKNIGDVPSSGPVSVVVELPAGVTRRTSVLETTVGNTSAAWTCSGSTVVSCTTSEAIEAAAAAGKGISGYGPRIFLPVDVSAVAPAAGQTVATISGGGAAAPVSLALPVSVEGVLPGFGMTPGAFHADLFDRAIPPLQQVRQAGTHPFAFQLRFDMNTRKVTFPNSPPLPPTLRMRPFERLRTVSTTLPRGLVGNPEAVPKCSNDDFLRPSPHEVFMPDCPPETQVGVIDALISDDGANDYNTLVGDNSYGNIPVYNLNPPKGYPADFGFSLAGIKSHIYAALDPAENYAIKALTPNVTTGGYQFDIRYVRFKMWGVPGDPAHDRLKIGPPGPLPPPNDYRPFLTTGSACGEADNFKQRVESYDNPGFFTPPMTASGPGLQPTGCDDPRVRFEPEIKMQPTARDAGGPTGLKVNLVVPQRDQTVQDYKNLYHESGNLHAIDTPPMKKAVVTMPEGMTISTSAAQGLGNCAPEQIKLGTNEPVTCPLDSQYGTLTLRTPILPSDEPMVGRIFIAKQNQNPYNDFLALYLVIQDTDRGLLVKIPAKVELDPVTGQIKTTFDELPQFPVSDMELAFKGGVRAALVNPTTCGTKTIKAEFFSYARPGTPIVSNSNYEITRKADGSPCVNQLGERPFRPQMEAGTISPSAGSYSPFVYRVQRSDDDQEFSQLDVKLPKGLLANISGVTKCSDAAIAASANRSGTEEANGPSCPASSQIGTTDVGSGVGQVITYIPGKAYLAGPYRGAPLSMVVITPILAGPYDLGVIAVRSRIQVNTDTTEASVQTDPFPQIFKGIPVRIRDIRVKADRPNTMINPTSCNPMAIGSLLTGTGGDVNTTADDTAANVSSRFQASNCENLAFKPDLRFELKGGTNRGDYPALTATLRGRPGDANISYTRVALPQSAFLAQEHIRTVCTRVQFAAEKCPEASIYGHASAKSPLFDQTLEGPVYLRSSSNKLPDLVATLNGDIDVVLVGRIDSTRKGEIRNTFDVVPDAPVTQFVLRMQGGKKGLLVNSKNLCKSTNRADVRMTGQNGKRFNSRPLVVAKACKGKKRGGGKGRAKAKR